MAAVETGILTLALVRRVWRRLPFFIFYLGLLVMVDWTRWVVWTQNGVASSIYSWTFWLTQPMLILARAGALADICRAALRAYTGVWQVARMLLAGTAAAMLLVAAARTAGTLGIISYCIFVERELEIAIVVIVVLLLTVCRYYGVRLQRPLGAFAFGLAFYSSVVVINSSVSLGRLSLPWAVFSDVRILAFNVALLAWTLALRFPLPESEVPALQTAPEFEEASFAVDQRMRELNKTLLQLIKR